MTIISNLVSRADGSSTSTNLPQATSAAAAATGMSIGLQARHHAARRGIDCTSYQSHDVTVCHLLSPLRPPARLTLAYTVFYFPKRKQFQFPSPLRAFASNLVSFSPLIVLVLPIIDCISISFNVHNFIFISRVDVALYQYNIA